MLLLDEYQNPGGDYGQVLSNMIILLSRDKTATSTRVMHISPADAHAAAQQWSSSTLLVRHDTGDTVVGLWHRRTKINPAATGQEGRQPGRQASMRGGAGRTYFLFVDR